MTPHIYAYIWEYIVKDDGLAAFAKSYDPDGLWAELFKSADGYLSTELHSDLENQNRFVTIDYWLSREAHELCIERNREQYQRLDDYCAAFTETERAIGGFACLRPQHLRPQSPKPHSAAASSAAAIKLESAT